MHRRVSGSKGRQGKEAIVFVPRPERSIFPYFFEQTYKQTYSTHFFSIFPTKNRDDLLNLLLLKVIFLLGLPKRPAVQAAWRDEKLRASRAKKQKKDRWSVFGAEFFWDL